MRWSEDDLDAFKKRADDWKRIGTVRTHFVDGNHPDPGPKRHSKYNNKITYVDGLRFDSKKEAERWQELQLMERAGEIVELDRQVRFELRVNRQEICGYVADFTYRPVVGRKLVVEDVKGKKTRNYMLKKKLMKAIHGIDILET